MCIHQLPILTQYECCIEIWMVVVCTRYQSIKRQIECCWWCLKVDNKVGKEQPCVE